MKKILCFRNSKLGDYLISIPALKLIRKKYPNCKIYYLLAENKQRPYLPKKIEKEIIVDKFIYFKHDLTSWIKTTNILRKQKFDIFYYLQEKPNLYRETRDYLYFWILGIKEIYGFFQIKLNYSNFNESFQVAKRVDKNINKVKLNNLTKIKNLNNKPIYNFKYISISIGGFSQPILWKKQYWTILTNLLIKKFSYKIIILGTKEDIEKSNYITKQNKKYLIPLCGKTNLNQLMNIIKFSKLHITNDNGSMHIASLFLKKTICLFNNHDPVGKWQPANKNSITIRSKRGVNTIHPYYVFAKVNKLLKI